MFAKKYKIPTVCDSYLNLYDKCNIGCEFCKFNKKIEYIKLNEINFDEYKSKKVLVCYSVDPYPNGYKKEIVPNVIQQLHNNKCNIVFLTRRAKCLTKDLNFFNERDYIGVSISEGCDKNSSTNDIQKLFNEAKKKGIKTWISLEPIETFEFAIAVINRYKNTADFIRIGKNDLDYNHEFWEEIKLKINQLNIENVFVKE